MYRQFAVDNLASNRHHVEDSEPSSAGQLRSEVELLVRPGIRINWLNEETKKRDSSVPRFPVNGSISLLNQIYVKLKIPKAAFHRTDSMTVHALTKIIPI